MLPFFEIAALPTDADAVWLKINGKTKPLGALGRLEEMAAKLCAIQQTCSPKLQNPQIVVFAADHGIAHEGVSAYPQAVTWQMVENFLRGGAAINVFCRQHQIGLCVVDAGVNHHFSARPALRDAKIGFGTKNFFREPAMTVGKWRTCLEYGAEIVKEIHEKGCNVIGFGEMGIGNTSSASALMSRLCGLPLEECVGRGTGLDDEKLEAKLKILQKALQRYESLSNTEAIMAAVGGFEIGQLCGAMLQAAALRMVVLVDGFIASAAFLCAFHLNPLVKEYAFFSHESGEKGHQALLNYLKAKPLLQLGLRLGEGTGCALAFPLLKSAELFLQEMSSFDSAGVSEKKT